MIKIGGENITKKTARDFFRSTKSEPTDLINWLSDKKELEAPCLAGKYCGKFMLFCSWNPKDAGRLSEKILIPANIYNIWDVVREDKKEWSRFVKFLKGI